MSIRGGQVSYINPRHRFAILDLAVLHPKLSPRELVVLIVLAAHANNAGTSWPSRETIAKEAGLRDVRAVSKSIKKLETRRVISVDRTQRPSLYTILPLPDCEIAFRVKVVDSTTLSAEQGGDFDQHMVATNATHKVAKNALRTDTITQPKKAPTPAASFLDKDQDDDDRRQLEILEAFFDTFSRRHPQARRVAFTTWRRQSENDDIALDLAREGFDVDEILSAGDAVETDIGEPPFTLKRVLREIHDASDRPGGKHYRSVPTDVARLMAEASQ